MGAEDVSVVLELPVAFESGPPELAADFSPDVAAAERLPEALDSVVPLAVLEAAAVDPADAELEPVIFSEPGGDLERNKRYPIPSFCRLTIIPSISPMDGGHGQAVDSVLKSKIAESKGTSSIVRMVVDAVGSG